MDWLLSYGGGELVNYYGRIEWVGLAHFPQFSKGGHHGTRGAGFAQRL